MNPSGVWATRPIRPPWRVTRTSSAAVRSWSGANIAPNTEVTTSNKPGSNGALGVALPELGLDDLGSGTLAGVVEQRGDVVHPDDLAAMPGRREAALPDPVATSSTRSVEWRSSDSMSRSELMMIWVPIMCNRRSTRWPAASA